MKLMSLKEALKNGKTAIEEAMIPVKVQQAKMQAEMEMLKIDEKLVTLKLKQSDYTTACPVKFDQLFDTMDEMALLERRREQFKEAIAQLFPNEEEGSVNG